MRRVLMVYIIFLFLVSSLIVLPPVNAQSSESSWQVVSLNGFEPPPPGIDAQLDWSGWGGGPTCDGTFIEGYFMGANAFSPSLPTSDFAVYLYCVPISSQFVTIAFYKVDNWAVEVPSAVLIAVREFYIEGDGEVWVYVKIGRSAPFSFNNVVAEVSVPNAYGLPLRKTPSDYKACQNTQVPWVGIGDKARITPGAANNLRRQPSKVGKLLASIPGGARITILDGPVCDSNGTAYWKVRYGSLEGWTAQGDRNGNWIEREPAAPLK